MKKVHEIPSLHSLSLKTSAFGSSLWPLGRHRVHVTVPRQYIDEFLKMKFGEYMKKGWNQLADNTPGTDPNVWQVATDYLEKAEKEWDKICDNHEDKKQRTEGKEDWKKLCEGTADWEIENNEDMYGSSIQESDLSDMIETVFEELETNFEKIDNAAKMDKVFAQLKKIVYERISLDDSSDSSD